MFACQIFCDIKETLTHIHTLHVYLGECQGPTAPGGGVSCRGQVQTTIPDAGLDSGVSLHVSYMCANVCCYMCPYMCHDVCK